MKRIIGIVALAFIFSMCSTEIDLLDDWKESCVVYGLLDQTQPKQYIRIQKAFLGPDNALNMAQQYDSINYINTLDVRVEELLNGSVTMIFPCHPDTFYNKQDGDFYSPMQVIYSFDTPIGGFPSNREYRVVINNSQTGNTVDATTKLVENFNISSPVGTSISFINTATVTQNEIKWNGAPSARVYQASLIFHYFETDINSVTTAKVTAPWVLGSVETDESTASGQQNLKYEKESFFRFLMQAIPSDPNVVGRKSDYVEYIVYAGGEELKTYMDVNGPSSGLIQEKPIYTNINNGLGLWSARTSSVKSNLALTPQSLDSLSYGRFSCSLLFEDRNGVVMGCQ